MSYRTSPKVVLPALLLAALLAACGDVGGTPVDVTTTTAGIAGSGVAAADTTTTTATVTTTTVAAGPEASDAPADGRILVSSSAITGHQGHLLLVFGPDNASELCAQIDGDPWTLEEAALTARAADSNPCTGSLADAVFEPGAHAVTAAILVPGSQTALVSTAALVELVDGDARLQLDGTTLSVAAPGEPGHINVTVSEISGQSGKVLVVLGQNNAASLCAMIDADPWALPTPGTLRELPGGEGGPCGEDTPEVLFAAGTTKVTAAIYVPGTQTPEATLDVVVPVDGDVTVAIDGTRLSG